MNITNHKTVWITGASSGIGEALAYQFAQKGYQLVLSARRVAELERVAQATGLPQEQVLVLPMDMLDFASFPEKVNTVLTHFGSIDILVQNAGISHRSSVAEGSFPIYRQVMELDFFSVVALTKAILPHWQEKQSGHLVAISSVAGKIGIPDRSAYCAAKHALVAFCDSFRAEVWKEQIAVTAVCPGYIKTNISYNALDAQGGKYGKLDDTQAKGMSAETCASMIVKGVQEKRDEIYMGGFREMLGVYLKRLSPAFVRRMLRKK